MEITKIVVRKQWIRGDDFNTYQLFKFAGDDTVYSNLDASVDEVTNTVIAIEDSMKFTSTNNDVGTGIISVMTWQS